MFLPVRLEEQLKHSFMEWRYPHPTRWNRRCPALLSEILSKFEMQADPSTMAEELYNLSIQMSDVKVRLPPQSHEFSGNTPRRHSLLALFSL